MEAKAARKAGEPAPRGTFDGLVGGVYGAEVTHGQNGWHYHRHKAIAWDRNATPEDLRRLELRAAQWWQECVRLEMGPEYEPSLERGCKVTASNRDDYLSKLGLEVAAIGTKLADGENRTPWGILQAAAEGDAIGGDLWNEYCAAMQGRKAVQFSQGLIDLWRSLGWRQTAEDAPLAVEADPSAALQWEIPGPAWTIIRQKAATCWALEAEDEAEVKRRFMSLARLQTDWSHEPDQWGSGAVLEAEATRVEEPTGERPLSREEYRAALAGIRQAHREAVDTAPRTR